MEIGAVIFEWGGTLSEFVDAELVDAWRLAACHIDPGHEDDIVALLVPVRADFRATTPSHTSAAQPLPSSWPPPRESSGSTSSRPCWRKPPLPPRRLDAAVRHNPDAEIRPLPKLVELVRAWSAD